MLEELPEDIDVSIESSDVITHGAEVRVMRGGKVRYSRHVLRSELDEEIRFLMVVLSGRLL